MDRNQRKVTQHRQVTRQVLEICRASNIQGSETSSWCRHESECNYSHQRKCSGITRATAAWSRVYERRIWDSKDEELTQGRLDSNERRSLPLVLVPREEALQSAVHLPHILLHLDLKHVSCCRQQLRVVSAAHSVTGQGTCLLRLNSVFFVGLLRSSTTEQIFIPDTNGQNIKPILLSS